MTTMFIHNKCVWNTHLVYQRPDWSKSLSHLDCPQHWALKAQECDHGIRVALEQQTEKELTLVEYSLDIFQYLNILWSKVCLQEFWNGKFHFHYSLWKKNGVLIVSLNYINHMYSECRHQSTNRKLLKKDFCLSFSTLECVSLKTYFHFTDHTGYSSKHLYTALRSIPSLPIPSNCSRKYAM